MVQPDLEVGAKTKPLSDGAVITRWTNFVLFSSFVEFIRLSNNSKFWYYFVKGKCCSSTHGSEPLETVSDPSTS